MRIGENIHLRVEGRYEARYIKTRDENGRTKYGYCFGIPYDEAAQKRNIVMGSIVMPEEKIMPAVKRLFGL